MRQKLHTAVVAAVLTLALMAGYAQITQPTPANIGNCGLRLSLTSGTPITTADVTAATSVFVTPINGGQCSFFDGTSAWQQLGPISEITVAVPATTSTMYDVFCFNNAGTANCDAAVAWTNDSTRATALVLQNGVNVKSGTTTRRYIGSFRTTTASGQTEDSVSKRLVWSYYNRVRRPLIVREATATWTYTTATYRQVNAAVGNQLAVVVGVSESTVELHAIHSATNSSAAPGVLVATAIGLDGIGSVVPNEVLVPAYAYTANQIHTQALCRYLQPAGYHFYVWMEYSTASGTTTWTGTSGAVNLTGINGSVEG